MKTGSINKTLCHLLLTCFLASIVSTSWAAKKQITADTALSKNNTQTLQTPLTSLAPILKQVMPAIVNISVQGELPPAANSDSRGKHSSNPQQQNKVRKFQSIGSGVVLDPRNGYIVTNAHVIKSAKVITVTLHDGQRIKANLVGTDPISDLAIIHVKAKNLQNIPLADSNELQVGDFVVAIGNPFDLNTLGTSQTATFGIVSALNRSNLNLEGMESFIQTDAAINFGNSGGALIDIHGHLVGINTAILSPNGIGNIGIGFAIPINMVRSVANQLIKFGSVHRGMMGVFVQHLTPELATAFGLENVKGAIITQINPGSPAAKAGLEAGDVIQTINGTRVMEASQVKNIVGLLRVNSTVKLEIIRDGKLRKITAKVTDVHKNEEKLIAQHPFLYGLALHDISQQSPIHGLVKGVQIVGASENSPAWRAGLRPGDVIIDANKENVDDLKGLQQIAESSKHHLLLHILRGPGALYMLIK